MKICHFDYRIYDKTSKDYLKTNFIFLIKSPFGGNLELFKLRKNDFNSELIKLKANNYEIELGTGLYDKNNFEIYENDIVKCTFSFYDKKLNVLKEDYKILRVVYVEKNFFFIENSIKAKNVSLKALLNHKHRKTRFVADLISACYLEDILSERLEVIGNFHKDYNNA